jgi:hypothetical protein
LADGLKNLEFHKELSTRWRVVVTFSDADNLATTFSLGPVRTPDHALQLPALQQDVLVIARSLGAMIPGEAVSLQQETSKTLAPGC